MAYGQIYKSTFQQVKTYSTTEWQIKIYKEGYAGAITEIKTTKDSIVLRREGDLRSHVLPTTFEFSVENETEGQFSDFADASWGEYQVLLIKDPNGTPENYYRGYNQSEIYTEPFGDTGGGVYPSQLKFTCGLSHLKYVRWNNSGTIYTGQKALIEIIRLATNKIPQALSIREFANVYESTQPSTTIDSTLEHIFLDSELFKKMTKEEGAANEESAYMCYEVLNEICKSFRCHFFYAGDKWFMIRKQEYDDSTMYYREFLPRVGSESTITVDSVGNWTANKKSVTNNNAFVTDIILPAADAEKETVQPLNRAKITFTQQSVDFQNNNILKNGDFEMWENQDTTAPITYNGFPKYWTEGSGVDYTTYFANVGTTSFYHPITTSKYEQSYQFDPSSYITAGTYDSTKYIQYEKLGVQVGTADTISLDFNFYMHVEGAELVSGGFQWLIDYLNEAAKLTFECQIKIGTYYLTGNATAGYSWGTTAGNAKLEINGFGSWTDTSGGWFMDQFNLTLTTPNLPESGLRDIQFRIYQPYSDFTSWSNATAQASAEILALYPYDVALNYLPSGLEPVNEQILYADVFEDENYEEISVIIGDSSNSVSQGALKISTGANTIVWNRRGITENVPLLEILLKSLRDNLGGYGEMVNGKLIGEFYGYNTISMTVGAVTTHYLIQSYSQYLETNEWDVSLFKLQTFASSLTVTDSTVLNPPPTPTTLDPPEGGDPAARTTTTPTVNIGDTATIIVENQTNLNNF